LKFSHRYRDRYRLEQSVVMELLERLEAARSGAVVHASSRFD
jgi:hypothetical protein